MKVILTENQIKNIILVEQVSNILSEGFYEDFNLTKVKNQIRKLILSGVAVGTILSAIGTLDIPKDSKEELINMVQVEKQFEQQSEPIDDAKIQACTKYMENALSNQGFSFKDTKLNPKALVKASEDYSFDLPLLLAAAHLESCFGATNRAKRTNSVFSVGAYDNGKDIVTYSDPNESIYGYIKLINNDYLINGRTINDLLKPGGFINKNGHRYASKKNYEKLLRNIRNKIINTYPELIS